MSLIIPLHYSEYYLTLERETQNALVVFSSPHCSTCRNLKNHICTQEISIPVFEVDATMAIGLIEDFRIFHLPTLILYLSGNFHRFFSPNMRESIEKQIKEAYLLPPQEDPSCSMD